jgi:hypothetical protein
MGKPIDEGRWLSCVEPLLMLDWLREVSWPASPRKLRLFGCACCRSVERQITLPLCRHAITVAEDFADGLADDTKLARVGSLAHAAVLAATNGAGGYSNRFAANFAAAQTADSDAQSAARKACAYAFASAKTRGLPPKPAEHRTQCGLVRCLFGNPFRPPPAVEAAWLAWHDATVRRMAELIYQERAWDDLPILADALEDAGCTDDDWLSHLRERGPHARGCHVLDALLGQA